MPTLGLPRTELGNPWLDHIGSYYKWFHKTSQKQICDAERHQLHREWKISHCHHFIIHSRCFLCVSHTSKSISISDGRVRLYELHNGWCYNSTNFQSLIHMNQSKLGLPQQNIMIGFKLISNWYGIVALALWGITMPHSLINSRNLLTLQRYSIYVRQVITLPVMSFTAEPGCWIRLPAILPFLPLPCFESKGWGLLLRTVPHPVDLLCLTCLTLT